MRGVRSRKKIRNWASQLGGIRGKNTSLDFVIIAASFALYFALKDKTFFLREREREKENIYVCDMKDQKKEVGG